MAKIKLFEYIELLEQAEDAASVESKEYQKELFLKYAAKTDSFADERAELLKLYKDGGLLTGEKGLRKRLGAIDLEYFGRAYLPHYFIRPSPTFHGELDNIWLTSVMKKLNPLSHSKEISRAKGTRRAIEAPRGHAKSTSFTFKDALHAAVYFYKHYILILSDSSDQSEGFLTDIKTELEDNTAILEDFGNLEGKVWKTGVILLSTGVKIEAIGSGKKIRGRRHGQWRPDLIICDDLENDENINTPEQRNKLANWFYKAVSKAGDTYTDIVYIGTLLHYDSLLAKVSQNPEYISVKYRGVISFAVNQTLWEAWEQIYRNLANLNRQQDSRAFFEDNKEEMLLGTKVLWEEKLSYYDLMVIKVSEGDAAFNSEIQNEPIDPANCLFNEEWFDFYDDSIPDFKDSKFIFYGANDPSLGKNAKADTSAIIGLAKDTTTGFLYVHIASVERRTPDVIINDAIETSKKLRLEFGKSFCKFGVEEVQFQYFFKDVMAKTSLSAGEYLAIEGIKSLQNKDVRIRSLQPLIKNGYIKFLRKHKTLLKQLTEYPMGRNDDAPDALQMCVKLAIDDNSNTVAEYKSVLGRMLKFAKGAY